MVVIVGVRRISTEAEIGWLQGGKRSPETIKISASKFGRKEVVSPVAGRTSEGKWVLVAWVAQHGMWRRVEDFGSGQNENAVTQE